MLQNIYRAFLLLSLYMVLIPLATGQRHETSIESRQATSATAQSRIKASVEGLPTLTDEQRETLGLPEAGTRPCVIDFNARWCMPCLTFAPYYEQYRKEYRGKAELVSCDVDRYPAIMGAFRVRTIPCLIVFDAEGKPAYRFNGAPSDSEFREALSDVIDRAGTDMIDMGTAPDYSREYYDLNGLKVEKPVKGAIYITRDRMGNVKKLKL